MRIPRTGGVFSGYHAEIRLQRRRGALGIPGGSERG